MRYALALFPADSDPVKLPNAMKKATELELGNGQWHVVYANMLLIGQVTEAR